MKKLILSTLLSLPIVFSTSLYAQDQCNLTSECKAIYGDSATDCANSQSNNSVCMCGSQRCDAGGEPTLLPGVVQAEDYSRYFDTTPGNAGNQYRSDDVDIQATSDTGGGFNVGWIAANEWLEYPTNVTQGGEYQASIRVASLPGGGMFTLEMNGAQLGNALSVGATGGWQSWQTLSTSPVQLNQGPQTLRVQVQSGNFNINWIEINHAGGGGMLGSFDLQKDMWLANFDHKPDADDIHSNAAVGTMLLDPRFAGINFHAVAGAVGTQGGTFAFSSTLYNLAFGSRWSNANANWNGALNTVTAKVVNTLQGGGDLWITEAGQSNFTADLVARIKNQLPGVNTNNRIHVVQHSNWNEEKTAASDLAYVKNNTDYNKIPDGNSTGNGSPGFNTGGNGSFWAAATSDAEAGALWREARSFANSVNGTQGWENPTISRGGMDFSDTSEATWIFGFNSLFGAQAFFNEFL